METEEQKKLFDEKFKFKFKTYLKYLFLEPVFGKFKMPNLRTISWVFIIISSFLRNFFLIFISVGIGLILHMYKEWKSGEAIRWYRNYHYKKIRMKDD